MDGTKNFLGPSQLTPYQLFYLPLSETLSSSLVRGEEEERRTGKRSRGRGEEQEDRPEGRADEL